MKRMILDCDPGIDDSIAIILAAKSPDVTVEAITTVSGNLLANQCAVNACKTLELINRQDIPVAQGMMKPLIRNFPHDPFSHGDDGLGNSGLPAPKHNIDSRFGPDLLIDLVTKYPGEISIVATGPLTNIAFALMKEPDIAHIVKEIFILGGLFGFNEYGWAHATGDNPVSDWNIYVDPEAAKIVFNSGMRLTAVGLDVATHPKVCLNDANISMLKGSDKPEARYMAGLIDFVRGRNFKDYCVFIDSAAVASSIDPTLIKTKSIHVDVETQSALTLGQTVTDHRINFTWTNLPAISAAYEMDFDRYINFLITRIMK